MTASKRSAPASLPRESKVSTKPQTQRHRDSQRKLCVPGCLCVSGVEVRLSRQPCDTSPPPVLTTNFDSHSFASRQFCGVAQLVERRIVNPVVGGSNPPATAITAISSPEAQHCFRDAGNFFQQFVSARGDCHEEIGPFAPGDGLSAFVSATAQVDRAASEPCASTFGAGLRRPAGTPTRRTSISSLHDEIRPRDEVRLQGGTRSISSGTPTARSRSTRPPRMRQPPLRLRAHLRVRRGAANCAATHSRTSRTSWRRSRKPATGSSKSDAWNLTVDGGRRCRERLEAEEELVERRAAAKAGQNFDWTISPLEQDQPEGHGDLEDERNSPAFALPLRCGLTTTLGGRGSI